MGEKIAYKNGDNKQFKVILDKESLIFESWIIPIVAAYIISK